jgi:regulator of protease activity HflC (stomatin/prohibitin superfamily)
MNRLTTAALFATLLIFLTGCSSYSPDAGHQYVLIEKPIFFGHGGIDSTPVTTGRTFAALSTDGVDINMQPQKYEVEMDDMMTSDGVPITFHAIVVLRITNSVNLITNFGPQWYENNLLEPYKTMVRQAVRKHGMNETAISTTALDLIDSEIHDQLVSFIVQKKLPIEVVTMTVGKANPPDSVKNQRIETATQEQRIQTEQQTKLAEDQRKMAEQSRAAADNAYREAMGLSPEQFLRLETIKMEREACKTATCILGGGGSVTPVLPVK